MSVLMACCAVLCCAVLMLVQTDIDDNPPDPSRPLSAPQMPPRTKVGASCVMKALCHSDCHLAGIVCAAGAVATQHTCLLSAFQHTLQPCSQRVMHRRSLLSHPHTVDCQPCCRLLSTILLITLTALGGRHS